MPFLNQHSGRLKDPGQFQTFRRKNLEAGIDAIIGFKKKGDQHSEIQAIRFEKDKFTPDEAKKWLKDHDFQTISFEEAKQDSYNKKDSRECKTTLLK